MPNDLNGITQKEAVQKAEENSFKLRKKQSIHSHAISNMLESLEPFAKKIWHVENKMGRNGKPWWTTHPRVWGYNDSNAICQFPFQTYQSFLNTIQWYAIQRLDRPISFDCIRNLASKLDCYLIQSKDSTLPLKTIESQDHTIGASFLISSLHAKSLSSC